MASLQVAELRLLRGAPGRGYEVTGRRKGWAGEQAWRSRARLCPFCFLVPRFTRDTDKLVCTQEKEQSAQGREPEPGNWTTERTPRRLVLLGPGPWVEEAGVQDGWDICSSSAGGFPNERGPEMTHVREGSAKLRRGPVQGRSGHQERVGQLVSEVPSHWDSQIPSTAWHADRRSA